MFLFANIFGQSIIDITHGYQTHLPVVLHISLSGCNTKQIHEKSTKAVDWKLFSVTKKRTFVMFVDERFLIFYSVLITEVLPFLQ